MTEHESKPTDDARRPGTDEKVDELRDRVVDRALAEVLGDESPPDLSAQILAAVENERNTILVPQERESVMSEPQSSSSPSWAGYITIACVFALIGGAIAYFALDGRDRFLAAGDENADAKVKTEVDAHQLKTDAANRDFARAKEEHERRGDYKYEQDKESGRSDDSKKDGEAHPGAHTSPKLPEPNTLPKTQTRITPTSPPEPVKKPQPSGKGGEGMGEGQQQGGEKQEGGMQSNRESSEKAEHEKRLGQTKSELKSLNKRIDRLARDERRIVDGRHLAKLPATEAPLEVVRGDIHPEPIVDLPKSVEESTRDRYSRIIENAFKGVVDHPLSTFSIDVDTASYANTRQYLMQSHRLPPADAVRIEELVNYFDYAYDGPSGDDPFASHIEVAACPWQPKHRLVRVALKGKEIDRKERPKSNLVFLVDVSGSMNSAKKLPLVKQGLKLLTKELGKDDRVAMVVYAGAAGLVLDSTVGYEKETINAAIDKLNAGGSTAGGAGIKLAYQTAVDNFIRGGVNRVILCSDGDFNVGVSNTAELEKMAEDHAKSGVFLSVMGFGRGNLNDAMMERITNKGNGNYAYLDTEKEAKKVFVEQMSGTLVTIAKDVKIQIEFNPAAVAGYRLIGYENRLLAKEDFNDDTKDAGEIGAGHAVTALYEIVPAGGDIPTPDVDELKYQKPSSLTKEAKSGEMLTLKLRYKQPDGEKSKLLEFPVKDSGKKADAASGDFKFASAVASFGMLLRGSKYAGDATYDSVLKLADAGKGDDTHGYRAEFIDMVKQAKKVDKRP